MLNSLEKWRSEGHPDEKRRWELLSDSDKIHGDAVICRLRWVSNGYACGVGMRDENAVMAIEAALERWKSLQPRGG